MAEIVVSTSDLSCTGAAAPAPCKLIIPPGINSVSELSTATIKDNIPLVNIPSFGMCKMTTNPTVIAATAAAMGTPTPGACNPLFTAPWAPSSVKSTIKGVPVVTKDSKLVCAYLGVVSVTNIPQTKAKTL